MIHPAASAPGTPAPSAGHAPAPGLAVALRHVTRRFGKHVALDDLSLEVPVGSIFGLVGPNGAGKTTTFSLICGYLQPDAGTVELLGQGTFDPVIHRGRVLALPQDAALGRDMPVTEQLEYFGQLQGLSAARAREETRRILEVVDLASRARDRVRTLSHGMNRRMGIAQAFLGEPELILLDEPTNGLDPRQAQQVRDFVAAQRGRRTVIISSHNLHEIERLCDHLALIDRGRVVRMGAMAALTGRNAEVCFQLADGPVPLDALRQGLPGARVEWQETSRMLVVGFEARDGYQAEDLIAQAVPMLLEARARISSITRGGSLERAYLAST